jgi:hypothetical protein
MKAGLAGDGEALAGVSEEIGFFAADTAEAHKTSTLGMIATVFEAVRVQVFDFAATDLSQRLQAQGIVLAESGFVPPPLPIDVLYLQRKFGGMFLLAARLGARVDVAGLLQRHL